MLDDAIAVNFFPVVFWQRFDRVVNIPDKLLGESPAYAIIPFKITSRTHFACRFARSSELTFFGGSRFILK